MDESYEKASLCPGGMGLDLGIARTGRFRPRGAIERDKDCCETILANQRAGRVEPGLRLYQADIERLSPGQVMSDLGLSRGDLSCLVGAPPCQAFSTAGQRKGAGDARGLLMWQYSWWLDSFRPHAFLLENVKGLLSIRLSPGHPTGSLLRRWLDDLPAGYRADVFVVDAADYGVPQHRQRVLVIGNRHGLEARFPPPTHGPCGFGLVPWRTLRDALEGLHESDPIGLTYSESYRAVFRQVPPGGSWRDLPDAVARATMGAAYHSTKGGRSSFWRRLSWDEPAPTLLTCPKKNMNALCHPDETRPLTVAEYARVQCFPDDWVFAGNVAARYRQIGNAVPVPLGEAAGFAVANLLDEIRGGAAGDSEVPRFQFVDLRTCKRGRRHRVGS